MDHPAETRHTLRQAGFSTLLRGVEIGAGVAFVSLIPRLMGPEVFGEYSLLYSISLWFALVGGAGALSVMVRYVPAMLHAGQAADIRKLVGGLLTLRSMTGALGATTYVAVAAWWVGTSDWWALAAIGGSIFTRSVGTIAFNLFLGLNQAARWGLSETIRRVAMIPAIAAGFLTAGLRGACVGVLMVEAMILVLGLWWARAYIEPATLRVDRGFLSPYLRFGGSFFAAQVLITLFNMGGGPLLNRISGGVAEAGFYSISFSLFMAIAQAVVRLTQSMGAYFSSLIAKGDAPELVLWVERFLRLQAAGSILMLAGAYAFSAPVVQVLLGEEFSPVAPQMILMMLAAVSLGPASMSRILCVAFGTARAQNIAAALQLAVFVGLCLWLVPIDTNWGAPVAVVAGSFTYGIYLVWAVRQKVRFSLRQWAAILLTGAAASPLMWAWQAPSMVRFALFTAVFLAALAQFRLLTVGNFQEMWRQVR